MMGWGRMIGERVDDEADALQLEHALGCPQARRCTGCTLRHLSPSEQRQAQQESHLAALRRLSGLDLKDFSCSLLDSAPRDGYRVRVTAQLWPLSIQSTQTSTQSKIINDWIKSTGICN